MRAAKVAIKLIVGLIWCVELMVVSQHSGFAERFG
jgi:hypothetical protein